MSSPENYRKYTLESLIQSVVKIKWFAIIFTKETSKNIPHNNKVNLKKKQHPSVGIELSCTAAKPSIRNLCAFLHFSMTNRDLVRIISFKLLAR